MSLNNTGRFFEAQFLQAWKDFCEGRRTAAEITSQQLLLEPSMASVHRAGCHLILAYSNDEHVQHAVEALKLYRSLNQDPSNTVQEGTIFKILEGHAETALKHALEYSIDHKEKLTARAKQDAESLLEQSIEAFAASLGKEEELIDDGDDGDAEASGATESEQDVEQDDPGDASPDDSNEIDYEEHARMEELVGIWVAEDKAAKAEADAFIADSKAKTDATVAAAQQQLGSVDDTQVTDKSEPEPMDKAAILARNKQAAEAAIRRQNAYLGIKDDVALAETASTPVVPSSQSEGAVSPRLPVPRPSHPAEPPVSPSSSQFRARQAESP